MITIRLSGDEARTLVKSLEHYLSELSHEIAHTDQAAFREKLKSQKTTLNKIVRELNEQAGTGA